MTFDAQATYTNERSYVLKLHRDAAPGDGCVVGQLEHIPSGRRYNFASAEELISCLVVAADERPEEPSSES